MTIVPLKQRDLFTRRWRKLEALDPSELAIQIALVARLRHELRDDVIFYHVPNGEYRDKRSAAKLKAMGVLPGGADLVFHSRQPTLFLELKKPHSVLSPAQWQFKRRVEALGCKYAVAHSVSYAITVIHRHGLGWTPK